MTKEMRMINTCDCCLKEKERVIGRFIEKDKQVKDICFDCLRIIERARFIFGDDDLNDILEEYNNIPYVQIENCNPDQ